MQNEIDKPQLSNEDISQLNGLSLAHVVLGWLGVVFSLFPLIHVALGVGILFGVLHGETPPFVGWLFVGLGITFVILGEAASICLILSGKHLKARTGYTFSFVVAACRASACPWARSSAS
jgi:hypothetical protein